MATTTTKIRAKGGIDMSEYCVVAGWGKCPNKKKKQTNADRIRSMNDEELADFLRRYFSCEYECPARLDYCYENCQEKVLDWLKQEVVDE